MAVLNPIKVVITNWEKGRVEWLDAPNNLENEALGQRKVPFTGELYIEAEDFMEEAPNKKYKRLVKDDEVRLMYAYFIRCNEVVRDEAGNIVELRCTYDPETKSGNGFEGRKPRGTIHWVSATEGVDVEIRQYGYLFETTDDGEPKINENSLTVFPHAKMEPYIKQLEKEDKMQLIRLGYYNVDPKDSSKERIVLNEAVSLKSSYK